MAILDYINSHQVFNVASIEGENGLTATDKNLLSRAVAKGRIDRVRRALYVSKTGRFEGATADSFDIASCAVDDAVFCYMSALQLHGVLHNIISQTQFYTKHHLKSFSYAGQSYIPIYSVSTVLDSNTVLMANGKSYRATSREQTLLDCLGSISRSGGTENLLRSIGSFVYLDAEKLINLSKSANKSTCARLGWVLQAKQAEWSIRDDFLRCLSSRIGQGPYSFDQRAATGDGFWHPEWRLYLPYPELEMRAWLSGNCRQS